MEQWKLCAGTRQRARPSGNKNKKVRKREKAVQQRAHRERREAEENLAPSAAISCSYNEEEEEEGRATPCDGADVKSPPWREVSELDSEETGEETDDDMGEGNGCEFVDEEAEEVWSNEEEMECSDSESHGSEEERGFVLDECREKTTHRQPPPESDETESDEEEEEEEEAITTESSGGERMGDESLSSTDSETAGGSGGEEGLPGHLRWKEALVQKAEEGFERRQTHTRQLHKLIYSDPVYSGEVEEDAGEEVGGLFHVARRGQLSVLHNEDCSVLPPQLTRDWTACVDVVKRLFVTGEWGKEDAATLLREDAEEYGYFEDLETGEKYGQSTEDVEQEEEENRLQKKKEQKVHVTQLELAITVTFSLQARFDQVYDEEEETGGGGAYYEDLKKEVSEQAEANRSEFTGLREEMRVKYEGIRPGCYVRMEIKGNMCTAIISLFYCTLPLVRSTV